MTDCTAYISGISFRFIQPDTPRDYWYTVMGWRDDGSRAMLLEVSHTPLDMTNTTIASDEVEAKRRLREICQTPRLSTFPIAALINRVVSRMPEDLAFVNVGVWHGFTFFAGLVNNYRKICIGIDNFSEFGGPREAFAEKFQRYKSDTHHFYDMDYREYFRSVHKGPIGFYIYDAEHSYQNQLTGLQVAEPFFAENCIVLVDDTNWLEPRQATLDFIAASQYEYEILFESSTCCPNNPSDMITELRYNPTWWNGIMLLQKGSKKASKQPNTRSMGESKSQIESRSGLRDESVRDQAPRRTSWKAEMGGEWERSGTEGPLVSIVISSHNDGHVLQKAIDSALDQTYPDIEVVVVDGGSIDDSREVIASYGDQIIPVLKENGGQASAFNAGFQLSRGEAILFLDPRDTLPLTAVGSGVDVASWRHQLGVAVREVLRLVPAGEAFVLVDSDSWGTDEDLGGRRRIPFLERDGQYGGAPPDDETAIRDLERLRRSGASFMVFAWPAFWWLEHYSGLRDHLRSKFRCVMENERLVAFDLRP